MENIFDYIDAKMRQFGFPDYVIEPVWINQTANSYNLQANNEYLFLCSKIIPADLVIKADNRKWTALESANYSNFNVYGTPHFTGQINMSSASGINLEFIKVIPNVCKPNKELTEYIENYGEELFNTALRHDPNY